MIPPERTLLTLRIVTGAFIYSVLMLVGVSFLVPSPSPDDAQHQVALSLAAVGFASLAAAAFLAPRLLSAPVDPSRRIGRSILLLALREGSVILGFVGTVLTGDKWYVVVLAGIALLEMVRSWPQKDT